MVDSGMRRGSDIVKALALGADMAFVGRATLYGIAAGGEAGAAHAIRHIAHRDRPCVMALLGCPSIGELDAEAIYGAVPSRMEAIHETNQDSGGIHARRHQQRHRAARARSAARPRAVGRNFSRRDRQPRSLRPPARRHGRRHLVAVQGVRGRSADAARTPTSITPSRRCR